MRYLIIGAFAEATCRHRRSSLPTALAYLMPRTSPTRPKYFKRDSEPFLLFAQFDVGVLGGAPLCTTCLGEAPFAVPSCCLEALPRHHARWLRKMHRWRSRAMIRSPILPTECRCA